MVKCSKCGHEIGVDRYNTGVLLPCPSCKSPVRIDAFPSLTNPPDHSGLADTSIFDQEAVCFFHPTKKAFVPCNHCGRFLCKLCDIPFDDGHICPVCLALGQKEHKIEKLERQRILYDSAALILALLPVMMVWPTILTAPATIFLVIRFWKAPNSIVGRTKIRFTIAFTVALIEIGAWGFGLYHLIRI